MSGVIIVDDQATSRLILERVIRSIEDGIVTKSFSNSVKALEWVKMNPPDLVLIDYKMPHLDGAEFTQWLRKIPACSDIPVVVVTGIENKSIRYRALECGATDFLTKPIDHHECRARCRNLLTMRRQQRIIKDRARWLERRVDEATNEIRQREKESLLRLAKAGEYRDEETGNHVLRIARYCRLIGEQLGLSDVECDVLEHASPMHDIGKIGVPDGVLLKRGPLDEAEWSAMRAHANIGYEILRDSPSRYLSTGAVIALRHHERFDGKGYPDGLKRDQIPLVARIVAVADVYDALISNRPYKTAWSMQQAVDYLTDQRSLHLDPQCVDAFKAQLDRVALIQNEFRDRTSDGSG